MIEVIERAEPAPMAGTVEEVLTLLRARGCRITSSRRLLLHALFDAPGDRTAEDLAEEVHSRAPDINLSTIYRNLDELERLGVVIHSHLGHGAATYQLASLAHGHLVCEQCGGVVEVPSEIFQGLSRTAKTRFGFDIHPYHFAVQGRCRNCQ